MALSEDQLQEYIRQSDNVDFSTLRGEVIVNFEQVGDDVLVFETLDDWLYILYHQQDCCASVTVEDIVGDPKDFFGQEVLLAEERTSDGSEEGDTGSVTWTFYTLRCVKGSLDIRWYGSSNGYYSERVSCVRVKL